MERLESRRVVAHVGVSGDLEASLAEIEMRDAGCAAVQRALHRAQEAGGAHGAAVRTRRLPARTLVLLVLSAQLAQRVAAPILPTEGTRHLPQPRSPQVLN